MDEVKSLKQTIYRVETENAQLRGIKQASRKELLSFLMSDAESIEAQLMSSQAENELLQFEISSLQKDKVSLLKGLSKSTPKRNIKVHFRDCGVQTETLPCRDAWTACGTMWWGQDYDIIWADAAEIDEGLNLDA